MNQKRAKYRSTEAVLYIIVDVVCGLCLKQLKAFSAFKKRYTKEYLDAILASLKVAEAMPSLDGRQDKQKSRRVALRKMNRDLCSLFQKMLLYMEAGFDRSLWDEKRKAAGGDWYRAALGNNWKASKTMQELAIAFMSDYAVELANGDMPDGFAAGFAERSGAYVAALKDFGIGKNTTGEETMDKLDANNNLYVRIQEVMKDGKRIFAGNKQMMGEFSYEAQMRKWGGLGDTGFRFDLKEADTLLPIEVATVSFLPTNAEFSVAENEKGIIRAILPAGDYSYMLIAPGYEEVVGVLVADTSVMHRVSLVLKKAMMSAVPSSEDVKKIG